jgi:signal transduction histidine kinase
VGSIRGTGIGLWGARRIVGQHGGHIAVESTVGEGTTVVVSLPCEPPQDGASETAQEPT